MSKLLIIDGHNVALRAYFGLLKQGLRTRSGVGTWGLYGAINSLSFYVKEYEPTHILVAFDKGRSAIRSEILPEYKANRISNGPDENYQESRQQINLFEEFCKQAGIKTLRIQNVEADDIIAQTIHAYADKFDQVVIVSADHDIKQLIKSNVIVVKPSLGQSRDVKQEVHSYESIRKEYDMEPEDLRQVWALTGDKGDNIPGVPGIGEKTALKLIRKYGSFAALLDSDETKIAGHRDTIEKAFSLVNLFIQHEDLDIPKLEELKFNSSISQLGLDKFLIEYELNSIRSRYQDGLLWKEAPSIGKKLFDE